MNKQHNNIKINVMKSFMHNERKQIKAKNILFHISNATKKETTQESPRHEKLCTFGTKQVGVENNYIHPQL
jgi:tRNA(Leu) C34 or U34 (ribose-2'-O)-methylase TrmL